MKPARRPSPQAVRLLSALLAEARSWRYGYDLTKETGLTPGTLYPLLERFAAQGVLESEWRPSELESRPPRHAYRLTRAGVSFAAEWTAHTAATPMSRNKLKPARG
jgi:PadR family transcriptional regulator PadR